MASGLKIAYLPRLKLAYVQDTSIRVTEQTTPTFILCVIEPVVAGVTQGLFVQVI